MTQASPAARPRPAVNQDNAFFWDGVARGELLVQRCADCGHLRHPPGPMCPWCQSFNWHEVASCGRGRVYSFVVAHRPLPPGFAGPVPIVLVDMDEGWRFLAGIGGIEPAGLRIGLPVVVDFVEFEPGFVLPHFRPAPTSEEPA
ncbi:Zn-ribbon domain-containing OB-fold protein [Dactylosporangium sp. CA-092794]|uniref:Zn-ribbon domain-containing OB-fold protein n=1 Tax=Dactylosporangium sp. CA-092794 TaxID=3239929 RepID=UPI003D8F4ED6